MVLLCAYFAFAVAALAAVLVLRSSARGEAIRVENVPFQVMLLVDLVAKANAVWALALLLRWRREQDLLPRRVPPSPRAVAAGALTALAFLPVMVGTGMVQAWVYARIGRVQEPQELVEQAIGGSGGQFAFVAIFAVTVAPLFEEYVFRGLLQPGLRARWGPVPAAFLSAAAFAAFHLQVDVLPGIFLLGLFLADLRERTGGLTASIAMHACYNAYQMVAILVMRGAAAGG